MSKYPAAIEAAIKESEKRKNNSFATTGKTTSTTGKKYPKAIEAAIKESEKRNSKKSISSNKKESTTPSASGTRYVLDKPHYQFFRPEKTSVTEQERPKTNGAYSFGEGNLVKNTPASTAKFEEYKQEQDANRYGKDNIDLTNDAVEKNNDEDWLAYEKYAVRKESDIVGLKEYTPVGSQLLPAPKKSWWDDFTDDVKNVLLPSGSKARNTYDEITGFKDNESKFSDDQLADLAIRALHKSDSADQTDYAIIDQAYSRLSISTKYKDSDLIPALREARKSWGASPATSAGVNIVAALAGIAGDTASFANSLGADKIPILKNVTEGAVQASQQIRENAARYNKGSFGERAGAITQGIVNLIPYMLLSGEKVAEKIAVDSPKFVTALKQILSNPAFEYSLTTMWGQKYQEALNEGTDRNTALANAALYAIPSSLVEVSGGFGAEDVAEQSFSSTFFGEIGEEIAQDIISGISDKGTSNPNLPVVSLTEDAIFNPIHLLDTAVTAAPVIAVGGAANKVINSIASKRAYNRKNITLNGALDVNENVENVANNRTMETKLIDSSGDSIVFPPQTSKTAPISGGYDLDNTGEGGAETERKTALKAVQDRANEAAFEAGRQNVPMASAGLETPEQVAAYNRGRMESIRDMPSNDSTAIDTKSKGIERGYGENGAKIFDTILETEQANESEIQPKFQRAYEAGYMGVENADFSDSVEQRAYEAGKADLAENLNRAIEKSKQAAVQRKNGGLVRTQASKKVNRKERRLVDELGKTLGVKIQYAEQVRGGTANGSHRNGIITIALDAINKGIVVAKHEITHFMELVSPKEYFTYRSYTVQALSEKEGVSATTLVEKYQQSAKDSDEFWTVEDAMNEIAADFTEDLLTNESDLRAFLESMSETKQKWMSMQKLFDAVRDFIDKVKKLFQGDRAMMDSATLSKFGATVEQLEKAEQLWKDMAKATSEKVKTAEAKQAGEGKADNSSMQHSLKLTNFEYDDIINEYKLTKKEWSEFYRSIGEIERGMWFPRTPNGDYIVEAGDKLVFTDGDFLDPSVNDVIVFENLDSDEIELGKVIVYGVAQENGKSEEYIKAIEKVFGEGTVRSRTNGLFSPDKRSQKYSGKRGSSGETVSSFEINEFDKEQFSLKKSSEIRNEINSSIKGYWHTNLSKQELDTLMESIKKDIETSTKQVTDKANWLLTRINGNSVFAIYSTEDSNSPTLLYESKGEQGIFERDVLLDLMEVNKNGKSIDGKSNASSRVYGGDWVQNVGGDRNRVESLGRESSHRDVGVLPGQSKREATAAFREVVRNLFKVQEGLNEETKFSLKKPVETTKNLVALHNMTEEKLFQALKLGGMPMPSIAITKNEGMHTDFGDITLIFDKKSIDPQADSRNKVYSSDIHSQTFPWIQFELNEKKCNELGKELAGLVEGEEDKRYIYENFSKKELTKLFDILEGTQNVVSYFMNKYQILTAFVKQRGEFIQPVYNQGQINQRTTVQQYLSSVDEQDFIDWLSPKLEAVISRRGISNGKEPFTASGKKRTFAQLHYPITLDNVLRVMLRENSQDVAQEEVVDAKVIRAANSQAFSSIEEIHENSHKIQKLPKEDVEELWDSYNARLEQIQREICSKSVIDTDYDFALEEIGDIIAEAARKTDYSASSISKTLSKYNKFNSREISAKIKELFDDIRKTPVNIFEAKPQRVVQFQEVLAAVVPKNVSPKLLEQLHNSGIDNIVMYQDNDEANRVAAINQVANAKFSLKSQSNLLAENKRLQEVNEALRKEFEVTKVARVSEKALDNFTRKLLKEYSSEAESSQVKGMLDELFTYMANGEDGNAPVWDDIRRKALAVSAKILENSTAINDDMYQEYRSLREHIRKTGISIDKGYDGDLSGYESINDFRKANFGRIKLVKDGISIDRFYQELSGLYPEFFDSSEQLNEADQLMRIEEVLDSFAPFEYNPYEYDMREATTWLANDIISRFFDLPQAKPTFADKAQGKLVQQKIKDAKKIEKLRAQKNKRIAELIRKNSEKIKALGAKERAKKYEAVAKTKAEYEKRIDKADERRKVSVLKKKIGIHVDKISKMLLKGNDNSHVPEEMRSVVGEFLSEIDLTTTRQKAKTLNRLNELRSLYQKIADQKTDIDIEFDPDLTSYIDEVTTALKKGNDTVSVSDLTRNELNSLYRVLLAVERSIYTHNRTIAEGKNMEISALGDKVMAENATDKAYAERGGLAQSASDMVNMDMLNPQDFFIQLGSTMQDMFQTIRDGFDKKIRHLAEAQTYLENLLQDDDVKVLSGKKAVAKEFKTESGQIINLTPAQVMSLYLLQKQPDALDHIYKGGIKPAPVVALKGKDRRAKITRTYEVVKVTPKDVAKIIESLTPEQKKIADGISRFFVENTSAWGNEVSMALYGYKKFTVDNYFPIVSDRNYLADVFGETTDVTLKNMGSTKTRQKGANNPIIIEDALDVFVRQADSMSSYNAFVIPLSDIQRVFNFKTQDGSVKQAIEKKFGVKATNYFKKLMTDINGGARWNGGNQWMNNMISRYKQAKIGMNLRVVLQQPTAYLRARGVIDGKYLAAALKEKSSASLETIYQYAPIARWKNWGFFSMDTSRYMKDILLGKKNIGDYTMAGAQKMDEITWKRLWTAAELEVKDKFKDLKVGSEEYYQAVGKRFSEIIDRTQVVDSVLHRAQILRNPDTAVKMAASFMSEPFKAYNMVRTAVTQYKNNKTAENKQKLWDAAIGYLSSIVINNLVTALVDTFRGEDDDEAWLEKTFLKIFNNDEDDEEDVESKSFLARYLWNFADNFLNEPLSMFPYVKDVVSLAQGYDVKRMEMQGIADLVTALKCGRSDKYTTYQKILIIGSKLGDLFGVPMSNVKREIETFVKTVVGAADNIVVEYKVDTMIYTVAGNKKHYLDILYKAFSDNDEEAFKIISKDMIKNGIEPSEIESGIKMRAKKYGLDLKNISGALSGLARPMIEKEEIDKFTVDDLSAAQYTAYLERRGQLYDNSMSYLVRKSWYKGLSENEKNGIISELKEVTDDLTKKRFATDFDMNSKILDTIYSSGSNPEDIVDIYLCDKYVKLKADVNNDDTVKKSEYVDFVSGMNVGNDDAWNLYLSNYDSEDAVEAEEHGIDAKVFMTAVVGMDNIQADYRLNGKIVDGKYLTKEEKARGKVISGSRREKIERYLKSVCNSREYLFLLGTEYESVKKDSNYISYFGK